MAIWQTALYAASRDADAVIEYIAEHSEAIGPGPN